MEKETLCINLLGGAGISKSTTAAGIFSLLKLHGVDSEIVTEFAKDLVWENRFRTLEDQRYLFGKQYHRLWRLKGKVSVVVTDSPLFLNLIYGKINTNLSNTFYEDVKSAISEFNNINVLLTRTKIYNPNGRMQTEEEAIKIDNLIKESIDLHNYNYLTVTGDYNASNKVVEEVLKKFNIETKYKIHLV